MTVLGALAVLVGSGVGLYTATRTPRTIRLILRRYADDGTVFSRGMTYRGPAARYLVCIQVLALCLGGLSALTVSFAGLGWLFMSSLGSSFGTPSANGKRPRAFENAPPTIDPSLERD